MAFSLNKVQLIGFLGADPELRYTPGGQPVVDLSIATNRIYKDSNGNRVTNTDWHRVSVWGNAAENAAQYLKKGRQVYVEGRLKNSSSGEGENKKYYTNIVADPDGVGYLGSNGGVPQAHLDASVEDSDIPF